MRPDSDEVVELTRDLIRIDSSNPDLASGGAGESAVADLAASWLEPRGFEIQRLEQRPGRPSVLAEARGSGGGRSLMLNGHLDTVSLAGYDGDPLDPVIRDGNLFGRGSYDMLSGVGAMMVAATHAHERPHRGDIVLALVADEENASQGTEEVLRHIRTDAAVVCEPSELELTVAHKGFCWLTVTLSGRAAHGSRPDLGLDAISKAGAFLTGLDALAEQLATGRRDPRLGTGSVHAGVIRGGQETSSYPGECAVTVERRTVPGETMATTIAELDQLLEETYRDQPDLAWLVRADLERHPFAAPDDSAIVAAASAAIAQQTGRPVPLRGEPFWTDCALLSEAGIDTVLFGVKGGGAHAATEWVELDSLRRVTHALTTLTADYCA